MQFNTLRKLLICLLICIITVSLCACQPYIDHEFINANLNSSTESTQQPEITPETSAPITKPEQTPEESTPDTKPEGGKKPGGFTLVDPTEPTTPETQPETTPETDKPQGPVITPTPGGTNIKVSSGLKSALNSLGKTVATTITVFGPNINEDGSYTVIHIKNTTDAAYQTVYRYYETDKDYQAAKSNTDPSACNDSLRMIMQNTQTLLPITNPETMSVVLFDGYVIWR